MSVRRNVRRRSVRLPCMNIIAEGYNNVWKDWCICNVWNWDILKKYLFNSGKHNLVKEGS